jgi:hypothetical protein
LISRTRKLLFCNPASLDFWFFKGVLLTMEEICRNCKHFIERSLSSGRYMSICRKRTHIEAFLKWVDDTCSDFTPKQDSETADQMDSLNC